MNKNYAKLCLGAVILVLFFNTGCEKNLPMFEPAGSATEQAATPEGPAVESGEKDEAILGLLSCDLEPFLAPNYITVLTTLFGSTGADPASVFNEHARCLYQPQPYDPNCCGPASVVLTNPNVPGGFEEWGPGFTLDPLSDGLITKAEQDGLMNRAIAAANANRPMCQGGWYNISGFTFGASPTLSGGGIVMHVTAHYNPVCFTFFP